MNDTIKYFLIILGAALISSALGAGFGAVVALISPEFVEGLFYTKEEVDIVRYAAVAGMIWGLFIGAAVGAFSTLLSVITSIMKSRSSKT